MSEPRLSEEVRAFQRDKVDERQHAMQRAALQILCGIDVDALLAARGKERQAAVRHLGRLIERERLKGVNGHWGYDLNRHIALKQALDRLTGDSRRGEKPHRDPRKRKRRP